MFSVHQKSGKFITVFVQTEEDANADVIDPAFHSAVHSGSVIIIIMLWAGRMEFKIAFFMISLLEQDVSADSCFF